MKSIVLFIALVFCSGILSSQSSMGQKKEEATVSKYSILLDKNTKKVIGTDAKGKGISGQSAFDKSYSQYLMSEVSNKNYTALISAYGLDSSNTELFFEMAKYYEITNNAVSKKLFCAKLKSTKLSPALREYAYNTLMSVQKNGILITYGEKDTYPIWILQSLEKVRTDVKVLNYDLLLNANYRKRIQKELGLRFLEKYNQNIDVLREIGEKNPTKSIYYSLTVSHLVLKELQTKLYPTGLALKYAQVQEDNLPLLKENWEKNFSKKEVTRIKHSQAEDALYLNYILPLLQLSKYYKSLAMSKQQEEIEAIISMLGDRAGKSVQVQKLLAK